MNRPATNRKTQPACRSLQTGFTLLELMVSIVILAMVAGIAVQALSATLLAWKRGTEVIDGIQHGDFAMGQLVSALNSTVYFYNPRKTYAFKVEKDSAFGHPADIISFVTSSSAFMPPDSPFMRGPHRIELSIDRDEHGDPALYVLAMPAIADPEEFADEYDAEPFLVARSITGLEILFWDKELEDWTDEWEAENAVPERIKISMLVAPDDPTEDPMLFKRVIKIPVFDSVQQKISGPTQTGDRNRNR